MNSWNRLSNSLVLLALAAMALPLAAGTAAADGTACQRVVEKLLKQEGIRSGLPIHGDDAQKIQQLKSPDVTGSIYPSEIDLNNGTKLVFSVLDSGDIYSLRVLPASQSSQPLERFVFRSEGENCGLAEVDIVNRGAPASSSGMADSTKLTPQSCAGAHGTPAACAPFSGLFFHAAPAAATQTGAAESSSNTPAE